MLLAALLRTINPVMKRPCVIHCGRRGHDDAPTWLLAIKRMRACTGDRKTNRLHQLHVLQHIAWLNAAARTGVARHAHHPCNPTSDGQAAPPELHVGRLRPLASGHPAPRTSLEQVRALCMSYPNTFDYKSHVAAQTATAHKGIQDDDLDAVELRGQPCARGHSARRANLAAKRSNLH